MLFPQLDPWLNALLIVIIALVIAIAVMAAVRIGVTITTRYRPGAALIYPRIAKKLDAVAVIAALWIALSYGTIAQQSWWPIIEQLLLIAVIAAGATLVVALTRLGFERLSLRYNDIEGADGRRMRTQLTMVQRLVVVAIVCVALGIALFSFPAIRAVGASLLASAGIASIIAGLAAQSTLGNLFAGIQLAFTDAIRVGDTVVVEGEYGTIGEITLNFVVVNVWDERRLVLPCTYFTTRPYEQWTRESDQIQGAVFFDLDWRVPLDEMREELSSIVTSSEQWDGRVQSLAITDATGGFVRVRAVMSARNASDYWQLSYAVRAGLVDWVRRSHPEALPLTRIESISSVAASAPGE